MSYLLLIVFAALNLVLYSLADHSAEDSSKFVEALKADKKPRLPTSRYAISEKNYFEKDNIMRFPEQFYKEEQKKPFRKSPKRTIQKIIKRGRSKIKFTYRKATTHWRPTASDDEYGFYTDAQRVTTDRQMIRKMYRRKQAKTNFARNPMLFQQRRPKRAIEKDNVYILNDLDEMKFLSKENSVGADVVNVNVKRYW